MESVVKCIVFHGRQNFPFRGHRDDAKHYDSEDCDNFQALLSLRVDSGDKVLEEYLKKLPKSHTE